MPNSQRNAIAPSELIINPDGSIFHLHLKEDQVARTIILVGDQDRVSRISQNFDHIECKIQNREFVTHTGMYRGKRLTALSTGIGTDNVDIVINELDALFNVDFEKRQVKEEKVSLNFIRLGTSGALHADIPVGSTVISQYGLGFDGLLHYYQNYPSSDEQEIEEEILRHLNWNPNLATPYIVKSSDLIFDHLSDGMIRGITATASGFYGPQGRSIRLELADDTINERLANFSYKGHRVTNFEMETSALFALSKLLGHQACTCCAIIANRASKQYSENYQKQVDELIVTLLKKIVTL